MSLERNAAVDGPVWSLSDGRAGNVRQAQALAAALGVDARDWALAARAPWRWCAPRAIPGAVAAFGPAFRHALSTRPPRLAIGCGRQAALATRLARAAGAYAVQILDPRLDTRHWDLVIAPEHDGLRGTGVIGVLGSLHPVDDGWLQAGREAFPALGTLPGPRTALLLGGPSRHMAFDAAVFARLAARLRPVVEREGGSLLATVSRRTPPAVVDALRTQAAHLPGLRWTGPRDGPNPYAGLLGWADRIVCSADSVNMLSEACATRAPVFVHEPERLGGRPRRFVEALRTRGRIRALDDALAPFAVEPLRETARVAEAVRARWLARTG